jgi:hypothetical protein
MIIKLKKIPFGVCSCADGTVWLNVFWSKTIWLAFPDAKLLFQMRLFNKINEIIEIF